MLPTLRLSPKNQVTIPAEGRSLLPADDQVLCARMHAMPKDGTDERFPVVHLLSRPELRRRETAIRTDGTLNAVQRESLAMKLRAGCEELALDGQNRVVLPRAFVEHLQLERDVFIIVLNDSLRLWNPEHFLRWSGVPAQVGGVPCDPALDAYLFA